uniref:Ion channel nompc n=1 Tax=Culex quinquefasciatus TaxID=7176 RepID=A0A904MUK3_CULQU
MFAMLRVYNKYPQNQFELRMERTDAGKFDDIWIKVEDEELFVQVKYESAKSNITKGMLLPGTKTGRDEGAFSLYKYVESFSGLNKCCVLLTNKTISNNISGMLNPLKGRNLFTKLFGTLGQHYRLKNDSSVIGDLSDFESINSFCKQFILSVNFPNAEGLEQKIHQEIEDLVDENVEILQEDAEHVFNRLRAKLVEFVCKKESRGTTIYKTWIHSFLKMINEDYKCITNAYYHEFIDNMQNYSHVSIEHERLNRLISYLSDGRIVLLEFKNTYFLRIVQSYQVVKDKLFTYLLFSRLNNPTTKTKFENALKSSESKRSDLLILVDDEGNACSVFDWIQNVPKSSTKIIVISSKASELKAKCDEQNFPAAIETEEITLADLSVDCREIFLKQKIMFQGFETELGSMPELSSLQRQIGETRLEKLINGVFLKIGSPLPDIASCCPFYIPRTFTITNYFCDVFQFRSIKKFVIDTSCFKVEHNQEAENECNFIDIKKIHSGLHTVHILKRSNENYNFLCSVRRFYSFFGNRPYFDPISSSCTEENILRDLPYGFVDKVKILSGEIGTGKSTTWVQLVKLLKKSDTSTWVVFIKLSDGVIEKQLKAKLNKEVNEEFVTNLMEQAVSNDLWDWEYLRTCLNTVSNKITVFLDGFDEICPRYKSIVIDIINRLLGMSVQNIFVSTRMYMENELQREFLATAYHLQPLTEDEQILLIKHNWSVQGDTEEDVDHIFRRMVYKLERFTSVYNFFSPSAYLGSPLAIKMIGNLPRQRVEEFLMDQYTIYDLFKDFVLQIFDRYCAEKAGLAPERNTAQNVQSNIKQLFYHQFSLFAFKWLFTTDDLNIFLTDQERKMLQKLSEMPIEETTVCDLILYPPRFIHRSYAEYFVAYLIHYKFERTDDVEQFWTKFGRVVNLDGKDLVGIFFIYMLEKEGCIRLEGSKVIEALNFITTDPARFVCEHRLPNCFRKYLSSYPAQLHTLVGIATQYNQLEMIKILLEHGVDQYDLLNEAILRNRQDLVQYLVANVERIFERDGLTLLHKAAKVGNIKIALEIIRKGGHINRLDSSGYTPTMYAYKYRQFYMASFLRERGGSFDGKLGLSSRFDGDKLDCFAAYDGLRTDIRDSLLLLFTHFIENNQCSTFKIIEQREDYRLLRIDEKYIILVKVLDLGRCVNIFISHPQSLESGCYIVSDKYFMGGTQTADTPLETFFVTAFLYSIRTPILNVYEKKIQAEIAQYVTKFTSINNTDAISFASNLKFFNVGFTRSIFQKHILLRLKRTFPFRCPEYTLARIQYTLAAELSEGTEWSRERANAYFSDLCREAHELHSTEARLKYSNFRFKNPVSSTAKLEDFLQSSQAKPLIVHNTIEAATIVQYLGTRIDDHIPGWMMQPEEVSNIISHDSKLVFVHNLDCQTDLTHECEDCSRKLMICDQFSKKNAQLKFIISLKHHSQSTVRDLDALHGDYLNEILHYPITFQANQMTLGMLADSLFKYCIESGALEYMALNLPISLGQQHPLYYVSWDYTITRSDFNRDESLPTFHQSLVEILQEKIAFISSDHELSIMACSECALPVEFPTPAAATFLACESSWRRKDKWVIALDDFPQIAQNSSIIDALLSWIRSKDHDTLSRSCLEFCLRKTPNDVVLILDARDKVLDLSFENFLRKLSDTGVFSVIVHIKNDQQVPKTSTLNFKLYNLKKVNLASSFDRELPQEARNCHHMKKGYRSEKGVRA